MLEHITKLGTDNNLQIGRNIFLTHSHGRTSRIGPAIMPISGTSLASETCDPTESGSSGRVLGDPGRRLAGPVVFPVRGVLANLPQAPSCRQMRSSLIKPGARKALLPSLSLPLASQEPPVRATRSPAGGSPHFESAIGIAHSFRQFAILARIKPGDTPARQS